MKITRTTLDRLNSPLLCLLIIAMVMSIFIIDRLHHSKFDTSSFVVAGDEFCNPALVPQSLTVLKNSAGFDGQFYYRLALNPFTSQPTAFGITMDVPSLRQQRILFPLLIWMLSLGNPDLIPTMMILINLSALSLMGWIGGKFAQALGQHALMGIFLPLYPGFLLTLSRDLVEILEVTLLLGSLLLIRRNRTIWATLLLSLAILTKETAVLVAAGAALVFAVGVLKKRKSETVKWYYFVFPLALFALWQLILFHNWGEFPLHASDRGNLGLPFVGPISFLLDVAPFQTPFQRRSLVEMIFLIGFAVGVLYHLRSTAASLHEICSWLLYGFLIISLTPIVWIEEWTFFRSYSQFYALGTIIIIASRFKVKYLVLGSSLIFWLYLCFMLRRGYV